MAAPAIAQVPALTTSDTGDTAWIIASSALVLMMTLPGLALFYGGLVRAKNMLSVVLQCASIAALASLLWIILGYTLAFGQVSDGWIGGGNALMLADLGTIRPGTAVPESAFALFQMTFAVIAPALMVGAWVERARFAWVLGFAGLWSLIVYAPVAHWLWGGGWLASTFGTLDFAGGLVVHTTAGVSVIVAVLLLGPRKGFPDKPMLPHAPSLTMVGAALLWTGWFGFNGGSALGANDNAASAILSTHIAASAAALTWLLTERIMVGKPTSVGWATGAIAGLATITPAAVFVSPGAAIVFGVLGSLVCYGAIQLVKQRWKIDDSLDVFAVHGVGGMVGTLLLAVFLAPALGGTGYFGGATMASQLGAQAIGIGVVAVWSAVGSAIIALMVSLVFPMRVSDDDETEGLDIAAHGERAYDFD
ncbi:ammonium transporter [Erythrobacter sp. JK5]|uniref:ammonium transporter n=1 Tax=Erythrobacter sp. JK5 TaxID=2829500 RepID=UPI001BA94E13|nr:ammonium transporter [Erythrobacter sp. JK5]QUL39342.1 ammonium transporter [Erythrobacter sp. JK5]